MVRAFVTTKSDGSIESFIPIEAIDYVVIDRKSGFPNIVTRNGHFNLFPNLTVDEIVAAIRHASEHGD